MTVQQILYFCKVVEVGSFSKAADLLFVSQPTLSQQISKLEDNLGVELLLRNRGGVLPTSAGRYFYEAGLRILSDFDIVKRNTQKLHASSLHILRVGSSQSTSTQLLPRIVAQYTQHQSHVRVIISHESADAILEGVFSGRLDVGFLSRYMQSDSWIPKNANVRSQPLATHPVLVAYHRSLLLPARVGLQHLAPYPAISFSAGHSLRSIIERAAQDGGLELAISAEVDNIWTMMALVNENVGIALLPSFSGIRMIQQIYTNIEFSLFIPEFFRTILLITGESCLDLPYIKKFVSFVYASFSPEDMIIPAQFPESSAEV